VEEELNGGGGGGLLKLRKEEREVGLGAVEDGQGLSLL
jgi:hypothetical protein